LAKCPGLEAIYLKVRRNAVDLLDTALQEASENLLAAWLFLCNSKRVLCRSTTTLKKIDVK
jgi:hypothetical protein